MHRTRARRPLALLLAWLLATAAAAQEERPVRTAGDEQGLPVLRVGTSGDYAPFSLADRKGRMSGLDVELARQFALAQGRQVRFVRFRWPDLLDALAADRFDLAWSGITVRPERSAAGRFSLPTAETGAVALVPDATWTDLEDLDRPQIRIGVNAGGHLERVAAAHFPRATRIAIPDNASVLEALREGTVQAVVTDNAEAPHWLEQLPGLQVLGPFTADRKAALVHPDRRELANSLDAWLLARERDGRLAALRKEHLGEGPWAATAEPLAALLAAVDERLSLMPLVAYVKRDSGVALVVPEREAVVLDRAAEAVLEAASRRERMAPPFPLIRAFFRAQMEAAKQIQIDAVADSDQRPPEPYPDLDDVLRPALLRIGDKIAPLLLELPPEDQAERVGALAARLLREPLLANSSRREIVAAIVQLMPSARDQRAKARASSPAATGNATQAP